MQPKPHCGSMCCGQNQSVFQPYLNVLRLTPKIQLPIPSNFPRPSDRNIDWLIRLEAEFDAEGACEQQSAHGSGVEAGLLGKGILSQAEMFAPNATKPATTHRADRVAFMLSLA